jgi:hypothetical protein
MLPFAPAAPTHTCCIHPIATVCDRFGGLAGHHLGSLLFIAQFCPQEMRTMLRCDKMKCSEGDEKDVGYFEFKKLMVIFHDSLRGNL